MIHEFAVMDAPFAKTEEKTRMNSTITHCKPNITILGSVAEVICATHIKGLTGAIEAIQWRINPAYGLDE